MEREEHRGGSLVGRLIVGGALAAATTYGVMALLASRRNARPPDSAPARTMKGRNRFGQYTVVGRTVTINKPKDEIYRFWREFENLQPVMENIEKVRRLGPDRHRWTIAAPMGFSVDVDTEVVTDRENELIAWRSVAGSDIDTEGRVSFRDAPEGRGTEVEAIVAYKAPGGEVGRMIAKLFQREPAVQGRRDLKRLKMLMEAGEVATNHNRRSEARQDEPLIAGDGDGRTASVKAAAEKETA